MQRFTFYLPLQLGKIFLFFFFLHACSSSHPLDAQNKIPVKFLIVNFFEIGEDTGDTAGERQLWIERLHLNQKIDFPLGVRPLYYNKDSQILNMVTNQGNVNSTVSMMALGLDARFDLSKAYILLAGIAGGDPQRISLGSAVWSRYIVDGDLKHFIDPREMPKGWSDGNFSYLKKEPNATPVEYLGTDFFKINPKLLQLAYNLTKDIVLPDDQAIKTRRNLYQGFPEAVKPPQIVIGDNITASEYWHGRFKTEWARKWVSYLTKGKGIYYTTAMEDTGVLSAIDRLSQQKLVDKNRVLSLRTISNFSMQWANGTAYESFMGEKDGYSGLHASVESAYLVGSPVIAHILENWEKYKNQTP